MSLDNSVDQCIIVHDQVGPTAIIHAMVKKHELHLASNPVASGISSSEFLAFWTASGLTRGRLGVPE